jgi:hypothetical protein
MKSYRRKGFALLLALMLGLTACGNSEGETPNNNGVTEVPKQEGVANPDNNSQETEDQNKTEEKAPEQAGTETTEKRDVKATVVLSDSGITVNGTGCDVRADRLKIEEAGTYEISGTLSNGSIYVNVDNESDVHLILNGVKVHNETSAPLFCKKAATVTITLAKGTENVFSDGTEYVFEPGEDEPDSTIYVKHDLVITGEGTLKVTGNYGDALKGKDSLYINGGVIEVDSVDDGIIGRDLLHITGGVITVRSESDALKSSNDTDETLGNILIDGGVLTLTGDSDDIQAENRVTINGGTLALSDGEDGIQSVNGTTINGGVVSEIE